jgi:hypothetical protein
MAIPTARPRLGLEPQPDALGLSALQYQAEACVGMSVIISAAAAIIIVMRFIANLLSLGLPVGNDTPAALIFCHTFRCGHLQRFCSNG